MSSEAAEAVAAMIASRAEERKIAFERRRTARETMAEFQADHLRRRQFGLRARHAAKLARIARAERLV